MLDFPFSKLQLGMGKQGRPATDARERRICGNRWAGVEDMGAG